MLAQLPQADAATLTGKEFFPQLISGPFHDGLVIVFIAAAIMSVIGAIASFVGGKKFVYADDVEAGITAAPEAEDHAHHVAVAHARLPRTEDAARAEADRRQPSR